MRGSGIGLRVWGRGLRPSCFRGEALRFEDKGSGLRGFDVEHRRMQRAYERKKEKNNASRKQARYGKKKEKTSVEFGMWFLSS